jgi:hypothetical protein
LVTQQGEQALLTPEVKALIGRTTEVREMYGVVDQETVRRYIVGIPDQDPRHWDEELAKPRFGATTTPAVMLSYISGRKPPWEPDRMPEIMKRYPLSDGGGGMARLEGGLPSLREVSPVRSHLHAGDEIEVLQYPKLGDRIFYQSRIADIVEKKGRDGKPFLLLIRETQYWNQDNELLLKVRGVGIERP